MLHRELVVAQHRAAVAHALNARGIVAGDIGLTFQAFVLEFDTATAGNLLGALVLDLDFK